jgi:hypothetical protein
MEADSSDFSQTTVEYVFDFEQFVNSLQTPGIDPRTLQEVLPAPVYPAEVEVPDDDASDFFSQLEQVPSAQPNQSDRKRVYREVFEQRVNEVVIDEALLAQIKDKYVGRFEYYYNRGDQHYCSYKWLLEMCANHIGDTPEQLHAVVTSFELFLVVPKHCLASDRAAQQHLKGAAKKWKFE